MPGYPDEQNLVSISKRAELHLPDHAIIDADSDTITLHQQLLICRDIKPHQTISLMKPVIWPQMVLLKCNWNHTKF